MSTGNEMVDMNLGGEAQPPENAGQPGNGSGILLSLSEAPKAGGPARPKTSVSIQNVLMMLVVAGSTGLIYGMRVIGMGSGVAMASVKIDYTPPEVDPAKLARQERMLASLQNPHAAIDVDPRSLGLTPFITKAREDTNVLVVDDSAAGEARRLEQLRRAKEEFRKKRQDALAGLHLQSVMGGSVPIARLNGENYTLGDRIGEFFTIVGIEGRSITLESEGEHFTLEMSIGRPTRQGIRR